MPFVSIFIPVYNTEKYLGQAIESVLNQTFADLELIILDDCSTDKTNEVAQKYLQKDDRIKLYRNEKNLGMMANWNEGLRYCKSKYYAKLDADDYWNDTMVEKSIEILEKDEEVGLVCCRFIKVDSNGIFIEGSESFVPDHMKNRKFSCVDLVKAGAHEILKHNVLRQGIGLMRRKVFDEHGPYTLLINGDIEMWYRIGAHYNMYCIDEVLHNHRMWAESHARKYRDNKPDLNYKMLTEVRKIMADYYFKEKKIDEKTHQAFILRNKILHNYYWIAKYRGEGKYWNALRFYWKNFVLKF